MKVAFQDFDPEAFSFHQDPVLVLEEFWTPQEQIYFLDAMKRTTWKDLAAMPAVARAFPNCGNWNKGDIEQREREAFLDKVSLPCIADYIESFPNIKQRHLNFNYYSYGVGDSLSVHDDTDEAYVAADGPRPPLRRLALVTYFHEKWEPDWGGELIVYDPKKDQQGKQALEVSHCIMPQPRSLALFAVPRFHRVCRIDPLAGDHRRMSIVLWFMTEHDE
jgi:SM-20-related protein